MILTKKVQTEAEAGAFANEFFANIFSGAKPEIFCLVKTSKPLFPELLKTNIFEGSRVTAAALLNAFNAKTLEKEVTKFILTEQHIRDALSILDVYKEGNHPNIILLREMLENFANSRYYIVFVKKSVIETLIRRVH